MQAAGDAFKWEVDYTMLIKIYGPGGGSGNGRYSPPEVIGTKARETCGNADPKHVSTSYDVSTSRCGWGCGASPG